MAVNFKDLLQKPMDEIERPKPIPAGNYALRTGNYEFGESAQKKTPYVRYALNIVGPGPDIDPSDLEGVDLRKKKLRFDFYITPDSEYRIKNFAKTCGINTSGRSLGDILPELRNQDVTGRVSMEPSEKEQGVFFNNVLDIWGPVELSDAPGEG